MHKVRLIKWCRHHGKQFGGFSTSQTELPYDLTDLFLGIFPQEVKRDIQRNTCIWMFIAAPLMISKRCKAAQMPISCWMNKQNVVSMQQDILQSQKGMKHWYMLWHGWTLETLCQEKEAKYERWYIVWFDLFEIFRRGRCIKTKGGWRLSGPGEERGVNSDC